MHDPPLPPFLGGGVLLVLSVKGVVDSLMRLFFVELSIFLHRVGLFPSRLVVLRAQGS